VKGNISALLLHHLQCAARQNQAAAVHYRRGDLSEALKTQDHVLIEKMLKGLASPARAAL